MWLGTEEAVCDSRLCCSFLSSIKRIVGRYGAVKNRREIEVNGMNTLLLASSIQSQHFINYLFDILNIYLS